MDRLRELSRREKFGEADYETEQRPGPGCGRAASRQVVSAATMTYLGWVWVG